MEKLCECGCGEKVKRGNRFIHGHNCKGRNHTQEAKIKISIAGKARRPKSKETLERMAEAQRGKKASAETRAKLSAIRKGKPHPNSKETIMKMSISKMRPRTDGYCDIWSDREYIDDLRKGGCERCGISNMMSFKLFGDRLDTHHIDEDKKNCHPDNLQTLCCSCHAKSHWESRKQAINH